MNLFFLVINLWKNYFDILLRLSFQFKEFTLPKKGNKQIRDEKKI